MPRRRKQGPVFLWIVPGLGALIALVLLHPQNHAALPPLAALAVLVMAGVGIIVALIGSGWFVKMTINQREAVPHPITDESQYQPAPTGTISEQLHAIDWFQFEKLIAVVYSGTGVVQRRGGANPGGGIDLLLVRNYEQIGIQCKHWRSRSVGVKVVREMIGAMAEEGLKRGIIVSLNPFSD